jgi:hypothetical protein
MLEFQGVKDGSGIVPIGLVILIYLLASGIHNREVDASSLDMLRECYSECVSTKPLGFYLDFRIYP